MVAISVAKRVKWRLLLTPRLSPSCPKSGICRLRSSCRCTSGLQPDNAKVRARQTCADMRRSVRRAAGRENDNKEACPTAVLNDEILISRSRPVPETRHTSDAASRRASSHRPKRVDFLSISMYDDKGGQTAVQHPNQTDRLQRLRNKMGFPQSLRKLLRFVQRSFSPSLLLKSSLVDPSQESPKCAQHTEKVLIPILDFSSESIELPPEKSPNQQEPGHETSTSDSRPSEGGCQPSQQIDAPPTAFAQDVAFDDHINNLSTEPTFASPDIVEFPLHSSSTNPGSTSPLYQMVNFYGEVIEIAPATHRRQPMDFSGHEHLFYQDYDARLKTFDLWPEDAIITPEKLAEAGFFYHGDYDFVRCYSCRGGLAEWSPEDDPWIEHARHYPNCEFLLMTKGPVFIDCHRQVPSHVDTGDNHQQQSKSNHTDFCSVKSQLDHSKLVDSIHNDRQTHSTPETSSLRPSTLDVVNRRTSGSTASSLCHDSDGESASSPVSSCSQHSTAPASGPESSDQLLTCKICLESRVNIVFVPCGHFSCNECCPEVSACPMCRQHIDMKLRAYFN